MKEDPKEIFAAEIRGLLERKALEFTRYEETGKSYDGRLEIAVKIVGTNITVTIEKNANTTSHSSVEPDPRSFGDADHVVQSAMRDWYPGKVNNWSETRTMITLAAKGLPEIGDHRETYELPSYYNDLKRNLEEIFRILHDKHWQAKKDKEENNKQVEAKKLKDAFRKI